MDEGVLKAMAEIEAQLTERLDRILAEIEAIRVSNREWVEEMKRIRSRIR
jgi:hypothetical protein